MDNRLQASSGDRSGTRMNKFNFNSIKPGIKGNTAILGNYEADITWILQDTLNYKIIKVFKEI